ncbi:hypothetical protein SAMN04488505_109128 [Chitinophaga rupis]|uniref:Uncharacterized protein n=1 Tax=Chitinophaga rupis TaxID=573321 RepID=A0A1H8F7V3_9BACT|nr:hypothetical protein SAMN04488505_109128 [Chitinophaga rupis]
MHVWVFNGRNKRNTIYLTTGNMAFLDNDYLAGQTYEVLPNKTL